MTEKWSETEGFLATTVDLGKQIEAVEFYAERSTGSADSMAKLLQDISPNQDFNPIATAAKNDQNFAAQRDILEKIKNGLKQPENISAVPWGALKKVPVAPIEATSPEEYTISLLIEEIAKKFVISLKADSAEYVDLERDLKEKDTMRLMVEGLDQDAPKNWREYSKIVEVLGLEEAPRYRILSLVRDCMAADWIGRSIVPPKEQP